MPETPIPSSINPAAILELFGTVSILKAIPRTGWKKRGVPVGQCESVAEHSYGVAFLASTLAREYAPHLNNSRIAEMALVHDVGERVAGDITPFDNISPEQKKEKELLGLQKTYEHLQNGKYYLDLWEEFEAGTTPEAQWVRQIDILDRLWQSRVYNKAGYLRMDEFLKTDPPKIRDPVLKSVLEIILADETTNKQ